MNWMRRKGRPRALGQATDSAGLGEAGNALDEDVAAGEQGDDQAFEERTLAEYGLFETFEQVGEPGA